MLESPRGRTRTPPELKWLLNERGALAGAVKSLASRQEALQARIRKFELQLSAAQAELHRVGVALASATASVSALDATMQLVHSNVDPAAAGQVSAWAGKYGKRGALKAFLAQQVQDAAPATVTTSELIDAAISHFGLTIVTPEERQRFRWTVCSALRGCKRSGRIEGLHDPSKPATGVWSWVGNRVPTLAELAARAARS